MNSKFIASTVVAIAALTGADAFAQSVIYGDITYFPVTTASTTTRGQVQAEYLQARRAGTISSSNEASFAPEIATP